VPAATCWGASRPTTTLTLTLCGSWSSWQLRRDWFGDAAARTADAGPALDVGVHQVGPSRDPFPEWAIQMVFVHTRGLSISFEDIGTGSPVVLGHSFLCSGKMWREQVPALASRFRVLNLDFRGHGRSSEVTQPFSLYDAVSDVVAVLDELGIEKAVWCGLSIGGMVALRAALTCPQRVERLILLDTDAGPESPLRKLRYYGMGLGARLMGTRPFLSPIARLMFGSTTRQQNPTLVREWKEEFYPESTCLRSYWSVQKTARSLPLWRVGFTSGSRLPDSW
jgi:pimeloyl-ACP methyl ester carboxylesterase